VNNTEYKFEGYREFEFSINNNNNTFILKHVLYSTDVIKNIISGVE